MVIDKNETGLVLGAGCVKQEKTEELEYSMIGGVS